MHDHARAVRPAVTATNLICRDYCAFLCLVRRARVCVSFDLRFCLGCCCCWYEYENSCSDKLHQVATTTAVFINSELERFASTSEHVHEYVRVRVIRKHCCLTVSSAAQSTCCAWCVVFVGSFYPTQSMFILILDQTANNEFVFFLPKGLFVLYHIIAEASCIVYPQQNM